MAQCSMDSDRLSSAGISTHSSGTAGTVGGSIVGVRVGEAAHKRDDENEFTLGPLPPMWEKAFTPSGEVYFIDHNSGTSHWLDPRLARVRKHSLGECGEDELPYGWERVTDERYGSYYVDHINRRTQYENPVLQARRLRAETMAGESSVGNQQNGGSPTGDLRGERFTLSLTKGTQGLGFTLIGAEGMPETEGYLQIRSIVPHSPAWIDGALRPGDVLEGVGARAVRGLAHAEVAQVFQSITPGTSVALHLVRGYPLTFDSDDPNTRVLSTLAVDAAPAPPDAVAMQQLTQALRTRFNLESPRHVDASDGHDEPDNSPIVPHSPGQRRMMSRSFDLDELGTNNENNTVPPRCPSADHLLTLATDSSRNGNGSNSEPGRELVLTLRRGNAGFGFTIADSIHGQKVKKVLDRSRCAGLREGDLLLQIGEHDVRDAPHQHVVQVLKECPALHETTLRVWRREGAGAARARSRSATRAPAASNSSQLGRSKTPTAEQLRSPTLHTHDSLHDRLNGMNTEATYAVPEQKRERESLIDRRRRSSAPGGRWEAPGAWPAAWGAWPAPAPAPATPTVRVDLGAAYWRGNASVADSSDNGGFPEDGMLHSPTTAAIGGLSAHGQSPTRPRQHSPSNSGRHRSNSPSNNSASDRLLTNSPSARLQSQSPSNHSSSGRIKGSPLRLGAGSPARAQAAAFACAEPDRARLAPATGYPGNYPQVEAGGTTDPEADVLVRLARGLAGFGFRIVGGTEDGSRVAVGYVVPGGPADGLLRPGDLLTSVDGAALAGASHARAVAAVSRAAARGHVTLGVRHNRADIQPLGLPSMATPQHQPLISADPSMHHMPATYNILHPAPMYPPNVNSPIYGAQYETPMGDWSMPYDVTITRNEGEGFGFVVISSTNKATSTIGQVIAQSPAARGGRLRVGDALLAINGVPVRRLPHPDVVALIKRSGRAVALTVRRAAPAAPPATPATAATAYQLA